MSTIPKRPLAVYEASYAGSAIESLDDTETDFDEASFYTDPSVELFGMFLHYRC